MEAAFTLDDHRMEGAGEAQATSHGRRWRGPKRRAPAMQWSCKKHVSLGCADCTRAIVVHNSDSWVGWLCYVYPCVMHLCAWQPDNATTHNAGSGILRGLATSVEGSFLGGNTPWLRAPSKLV